MGFVNPVDFAVALIQKTHCSLVKFPDSRCVCILEIVNMTIAGGPRSIVNMDIGNS